MKNIVVILFMGFGLAGYTQTENETEMSPSKREILETRESPQERRFNSREEFMKAGELTEDEANSAWPVYEEYNRSLDELRQKNKSDMEALRVRREDMTDDDYDARQRARFQMKRNRLDLDERYYNEFRRILPGNKVDRIFYYGRERNFERRINNRTAPVYGPPR